MQLVFQIKTALKSQLNSGEDGYYVIRPLTDLKEPNVNFAISIT